MLSKFINWMKPLPDLKTPISDEKLVAKMYKKWRIKMFFGMYIGYVMYYFTRKNISYAAPSFISELGITKMEFGILGSTMYVTYGIGKFLAGMLADKCNIRTFMAFGLIGSAIINLFFGFLLSLPILTFFWGVNGALQSMGFPPVAKGLVYWFSPSERATKWTLWSSAHTVGTTLIGIVAGFCITTGHWRAAFYFPGAIALVLGIGLLFSLTDKPSSIGLPPIEEYRKDFPPAKKQSHLSHWQVLTKYVFCNPFLWSLAIAYIFIYFVRFVTLDWGAIFMVERGIAKNQAAYLLVFMPFIGTLGGISSGWIADKFFNGRCTPINLIFLFCLIFSLWGMYHFTDANTTWWLVGLFLALVGFFVDGPQNLVGGVQASRVTVQESVSAACGFTGMFGYLGASLSGVGAAYLVEKWSWQGVFIACVISCAISMFFVALTWKKEAYDHSAEKEA
ncbi:MAG: MFS transporter [Endomicrobium sp.]|jgi:sugar phosphate permease|nr:MFS transporter [Endomicrobium sp.]